MQPPVLHMASPHSRHDLSVCRRFNLLFESQKNSIMTFLKKLSFRRLMQSIVMEPNSLPSEILDSISLPMLQNAARTAKGEVCIFKPIASCNTIQTSFIIRRHDFQRHRKRYTDRRLLLWTSLCCNLSLFDLHSQANSSALIAVHAGNLTDLSLYYKSYLRIFVSWTLLDGLGLFSFQIQLETLEVLGGNKEKSWFKLKCEDVNDFYQLS